MGRKRTKKPITPEAERLGARIRSAREKLGYKTTYALEDYSKEQKTKISHQTISNYENGQHDPGDPRSHRTLTLLASLLKDTFGLRNIKLDMPSTETIPITARVAAGMAVEFLHESDEDRDSIEVDPRMIFKKGNHFALRVVGESMEDAHILTGDIVLVREWKDRSQRPNVDDIIVADIRAEGITLKRWTEEDNEVILIPASKTHKPSHHEKWRVKPVAIVVGVIRMIQ